MTTVHDLHSFYAGDDWQINGSLFDENGDPLDVTNATIDWALRDGALSIVNVNITLQVLDPVNGKIKIFVPSASTTSIVAGEYSDILRVTIGAITDTMWTGAIFVKEGL